MKTKADSFEERLRQIKLKDLWSFRGHAAPATRVAWTCQGFIVLLADGSIAIDSSELEELLSGNGLPEERAKRVFRALVSLKLLLRTDEADFTRYAESRRRTMRLHHDQKYLNDLAVCYGFKAPNLSEKKTGRRK
jgi:hypothetical protein